MTVNNYAGNIMIADGEATFRFLAGLTLRQAGFITCEAQDGAEALAKIMDCRGSQIPIDLIILDLSMPYLGGLRVFQILRQSGIAIPVLFVAASVNQYELRKIPDNGSNWLLIKPFSLQLLLSKVEELLLHGQQTDAPAAKNHSGRQGSRGLGLDS